MRAPLRCLVFAALVTAVATGAYAQAPAPQQTIADYCASCHNNRLQTGGLSLESADLGAVAAHPDLWEHVARKLRLGVMSPHGARRPDRTALDAVLRAKEHSAAIEAFLRERSPAPAPAAAP